MQPIFQNIMLICQRKANLDEEALFGKITHHLHPTNRKIYERGFYWNREFHVPSRVNFQVSAIC